MNNKTERVYTIKDFYVGQRVKLKDPEFLLSDEEDSTFKSYISKVKDQVLTIDEIYTNILKIRINHYLFYPYELVPAEEISTPNISFDDFLKVLNDE